MEEHDYSLTSHFTITFLLLFAEHQILLFSQMLLGSPNYAKGVLTPRHCTPLVSDSSLKSSTLGNLRDGSGVSDYHSGHRVLC